MFGIAEFGHIAANKNSPAFLTVGEVCEDIEGVFHRGGVGIVAIGYDGKRAKLQHFSPHRDGADGFYGVGKLCGGDTKI